MTRDPDDLFAGLSPPSAPTGLKQRALAAALAEPAAPEIRRPVWRLTDALWESRPLRLTWAGAVVVLLTVHLALAGEGPQSAGGSHGTAGAALEDSVLAGTDSDLLRLLSRYPAPRTRVAAGNLSLDGLVSEPSTTPPLTAPEGGSV